MKNEEIIIKTDANDYFGKLIKKRGYKIFPPYKGQSHVLTRFFRQLHFKYKFPFYKFWYNKKVLKMHPNKIIIFETQITREYLNWLKKQTSAELHVWYWNIVKNTISPDLIRRETTQLWSFSSKDSKNHNMLFNAPPYFKEISINSSNVDLDIVFIGKDKGRSKKILEYNTIFNNMGLKTYFHIAPDKRWQKKNTHKNRINYSETLKFTARSKSVFDFIEIVDSGLSMRAMETLFLNKKLITNNILIKDYDFYNPNNIFILGERKIEELPEFIKSPLIEINDKVKLYYDFDNWLKRFSQI